VKEKDLRRYIKKEILLNEAAGDFTYEDVKDVFDAFKNVFTVTGIALKSIASALVLNVEVLIAVDRNEIKKSFDSYTTRLSNITREYESALQEVNKRIEQFSPILFITNPAAYISYQIADAYAGNMSGARSFLQDIGVSDSFLSWSGSSSEDLSSQSLLNAFMGKTTKSGEGSVLAKIADEQSKIRKRLDTLFGARLSESKSQPSSSLNESENTKNESLNLSDLLLKSFKEAPSEAFGISDNSSKSILELKRKEVDDFVKILASPNEFLTTLSKAKTLEDVKNAVSLLKNTPFVIKGIESLTPEMIESSAKKAIEQAKKKNKLKAVLKELNIDQQSSDEKSILDAMKSYQLKILLGQAFIKSSDSLSKQVEQLRSSFLKKFEEDAPVKVVSKIAPGSELEKIMKEGVEKITKAGKLQK